MALRFLRLIEYVYANEEVAAVDQARWTVGYHQQGRMTMRSAVIQMEAVEWEETGPDRAAVRFLVERYTNEVEGPTLRLEGAERPEVERLTDQMMDLFYGHQPPRST